MRCSWHKQGDFAFTTCRDTHTSSPHWNPLGKLNQVRHLELSSHNLWLKAESLICSSCAQRVHSCRSTACHIQRVRSSLPHTSLDTQWSAVITNCRSLCSKVGIQLSTRTLLQTQLWHITGQLFAEDDPLDEINCTSCTAPDNGSSKWWKQLHKPNFETSWFKRWHQSKRGRGNNELMEKKMHGIVNNVKKWS